MTSDPFERHARRLADVFARRLREDPTTDPTILAAELVAILRGHGWRPVEALQPPARVPGTSDRPGPPAEYLERRAALDGRPDCVCGASVLDHQLVNGRRAGSPESGCENYAPAPERNT